MGLSKPAVLAIGLVVAGCGPKLPGPGGEQGEDESSSESGTEFETESDGTESDGTETGEETETGLEPDLPAPDLLPDPDLPPEPGCAPYDEANAFEELCFGEPVQIDSAAVNFVDWVGGKVYVAGPDNHRLFEPDQFDPVPEPLWLAIPGTVVGGIPAILFEEPAPEHYVIALENPNALVVLSVGPPIAIVATIPLPDKPTAIAKYTHEGVYFNAIAVADVAGRVQLFDPSDASILEPVGFRQLDEPVDRLHGVDPWDEDWGSFGSLVGLSHSSSTVTLLQPSILVDGPIDSWPLTVDATGWFIATLSDIGGGELVLFSHNPSAMSRYDDFGEQVEWSMALDHPVHDWRMAIEHWGGPNNDAAWEHYVLSSSDARLGSLGASYGEGTSLANPPVWLEVPEGTVDFLPIGEARFLCASMSAGLNLLAPLP